MLVDEIKKDLESLDPEKLEKKEYSRVGYHWDIILGGDKLDSFARLMKKREFYLEDVEGLDLKDNMQVLYHFAHTRELCRITGRTFTPRKKPKVPTISHIYPGADWHERETFDFFGIIFAGHPNLKHLLLPEDADITPLMKIEKSLKGLDDFKPQPPKPKKEKAKEGSPVKGEKASPAALEKKKSNKEVPGDKPKKDRVKAAASEAKIEEEKKS